MFFCIINRFPSVCPLPTTLFLFNISYRRGDYYGRYLITYKSVPEFFTVISALPLICMRPFMLMYSKFQLFVANVRTWMEPKTFEKQIVTVLCGSSKWADSVHSLKTWPSPLHGLVIVHWPGWALLIRLNWPIMPFFYRAMAGLSLART